MGVGDVSELLCWREGWRHSHNDHDGRGAGWEHAASLDCGWGGSSQAVQTGNTDVNKQGHEFVQRNEYHTFRPCIWSNKYCWNTINQHDGAGVGIRIADSQWPSQTGPICMRGNRLDFRNLGLVQCWKVIGSWERASHGDSGAGSIRERHRELVNRRISSELAYEPITQLGVDRIGELDCRRLKSWTFADGWCAVRAYIV